MVVPTSLRVKERQNICSASVLRIGTANRYNPHNRFVAADRGVEFLSILLFCLLRHPALCGSDVTLFGTDVVCALSVGSSIEAP